MVHNDALYEVPREASSYRQQLRDTATARKILSNTKGPMYHVVSLTEAWSSLK